MADLPDLEKTSLLFAGEIATIDPEPHTTHGNVIQGVTYKNIQILMGPKISFTDPMAISHPIEKDSHGLPPDLFRIGTKLIIGTESISFANFVHRYDQLTLVRIHQALEAYIEKAAQTYLKNHHFDIGLVTNDTEAFLDGTLLAMNQIAERATDQIQLQTGDIPESHDVATYVQEYRKKVKENDTSSPWSFIFQLGPSFANNFWAYRPQPPGSLGLWQRSTQGALGFQYGQLGWSHTIQVVGSLGNSEGYFQNALAVYQLSLARMMGNPIDASGASSTWTYLVGTIFTQIGIGGNNFTYGASRTVHIGLLAQSQFGGQIALNIGSVQVIGQGTLLYSLLYDRGATNMGGWDHIIGAAGFAGIQHSF